MTQSSYNQFPLHPEDSFENWHKPFLTIFLGGSLKTSLSLATSFALVLQAEWLVSFVNYVVDVVMHEITIMGISKPEIKCCEFRHFLITTSDFFLEVWSGV